MNSKPKKIVRFKMSDDVIKKVNLKWSAEGHLLDDTGKLDLSLGFTDIELHRFSMATHENGDIGLALDGQNVESYSVAVQLNNCPEPCIERDDLDENTANELTLFLEQYLETDALHLP